MKQETIFRRPVLTEAWKDITKEETPCFFDTTNDYPKKYHIERRDVVSE